MPAGSRMAGIEISPVEVSASRFTAPIPESRFVSGTHKESRIAVLEGLEVEWGGELE